MKNRYVLLLLGIALLYLCSSIWGFVLQRRHEQLVDTLYRNNYWNISQLMQESQRLLYSLRLYRRGGIEMEELTLDYDLLWNRLDVSLVGQEMKALRTRYGLAPLLADLLDQLKLLEPQIVAGSLKEGAELDRIQGRIAELTRQIEQAGEVALSMQERETSVNHIRDSQRRLQWWNLVLLLSGGVMVFALIRVNLQNQRFSLHDTLTGLGNRRALQEQLARHLKSPHPVALAVLDLKRFKQVNDQLGYQVGDLLLQTVANKLREFRAGQPYRLGGDEFVVILPNKEQSFEPQVRELLALLNFEFVTQESSFELACRIGVACSDEVSDPAQLLDMAILALNHSKRETGSELIWFEPDMHTAQLVSQIRLQGLREWLAQGTPAPLDIASWTLTTDEGERVLAFAPRWQTSQERCSIDWLEEGGVLGPVIARLIAGHEGPQPLLLTLSRKEQLAHVLGSLPTPCPVPLILALPGLVNDTVLLAQLRQRGCRLALSEIGSQTPSLLAAGWPVDYWLPEPGEYSESLAPLAQRLKLARLSRPSR